MYRTTAWRTFGATFPSMKLRTIFMQLAFAPRLSKSGLQTCVWSTNWRLVQSCSLHWLMLTCLFVGCGGSSQTVAVAPTAKPKLVEGAPPARRPSNTLYRDEVESAKHARPRTFLRARRL